MTSSGGQKNRMVGKCTHPTGMLSYFRNVFVKCAMEESGSNLIQNIHWIKSTYFLMVGIVSFGSQWVQLSASTSYNHDMDWLPVINGGGKLFGKSDILSEQRTSCIIIIIN